MSLLDPSILNEPRFQQPDGWRWHSFRNHSGYRIRFGSVFPKDKVPKAVVVCLPGLREFGEKYFELAHNILQRDMAFWVVDWLNQGASDRIIPDSQKIHSIGFEHHVADLEQLIFDYIKTSAVHPEVGKIPIVFIGHSMGAHIGLRYLTKNKNDLVMAGVFSAPFLGIHGTEWVPSKLLEYISGLFLIMGGDYVFGATDWEQDQRRKNPALSNYTSDQIRDQLQALWFEKNPQLKTGGPTFTWVYEAIKSYNFIRQPETIKKIKTPVLLATAGKDIIVSSKVTKSIVTHLAQADLFELAEARHEILMERDSMRNLFLTRFDGFIEKYALSQANRLKKN